MQLSVVVPTLNGRERLARCLDALADRAPEAEVVVVNGPSVDGTTGMVRDREDVDVLVEIDERNINVARNAGFERTHGGTVAFLNDDLCVERSWYDAVTSRLAGAATAHRASGHGPDLPAVVTGPVHQSTRGGVTTETAERRTIAGRRVSYFDGGNVAFTRAAVDALDGFDEYLLTGGARDAAHRLAGRGYDVEWVPEMCTRREEATVGGGMRQPSLAPDGGEVSRDWHWRYRSLAYRLTKNYGVRPTTLGRIARHAVVDAGGALRDVAGGSSGLSGWFGNGRDVTLGTLSGCKDGFAARLRDRTTERNPRGLSERGDRAVAVYDRR
ncbi:glycosyltransferase family 2 protein [Halomarina litorea]|uniref:glycosyltransferase family 2 protein n=1 Tax=Halomarina litorea TaxID=2961595 RepID=UPI0020C4FBCB|nr:glycosyltransferase family 2 protein [Halomarina sp. BCD28]